MVMSRDSVDNVDMGFCLTAQNQCHLTLFFFCGIHWTLVTSLELSRMEERPSRAGGSTGGVGSLWYGSMASSPGETLIKAQPAAWRRIASTGR